MTRVCQQGGNSTVPACTDRIQGAGISVTRIFHAFICIKYYYWLDLNMHGHILSIFAPYAVLLLYHKPNLNPDIDITSWIGFRFTGEEV